MSDADGYNFDLYDTDYETVVNGVPAVGERTIYQAMNEPGNGSIQIYAPPDLAISTQPQIGMWVAFDYRGANRGGFFVEELKWDDANAEEGKGRLLTISGRGPLALLDDAIVWDWLTPGTENVRRFGTLDTVNAYGDGGAPLAKGAMLYHLLTEARDDISNPAGQPIERYCWRFGGTSGGAAFLDWDFSDTLDSASNAWPDAEDVELRVGTSLLDVLRQFADLGYDFTIDWDGAGLFTLHAYGSRIGTNKTGSVYFTCDEFEHTPPDQSDVLNASRRLLGADLTNSILMEVSNQEYPYYEVKDATSIGAYRRRESLMQAANAYSLATTLSYGQAEIDTTSNPLEFLDLEVSDNKPDNAHGARIYVDYALGDTVKYKAGNGASSINRRLTGAHLNFVNEEKYARVSLESEYVSAPA